MKIIQRNTFIYSITRLPERQARLERVDEQDDPGGSEDVRQPGVLISHDQSDQRSLAGDRGDGFVSNT